MVRRWAYPIVPEHLPTGYERDFSYSYTRDFIYREERGNTSIDRSSIVSR
jgi:hypothetical protein